MKRRARKAAGGVELVERIFERVEVDPVTGCGNWCGLWDSDGYGRLSLAGRDALVHRVVALLCGGVLRSGDVVMHTCDNRRCCNPAHLRIGSHADNAADKVAKGRQARGAGVGRGRLTPATVYAIRAAVGLQTDIAARFGVAGATVRDIKARRTWAWVPDNGVPDDSTLAASSAQHVPGEPQS